MMFRSCLDDVYVMFTFCLDNAFEESIPVKSFCEEKTQPTPEESGPNAKEPH